MPIYAYKCQECGHYLDKLQRISDLPLVDCPECEQPALRKQITAAAFKLKGTGWYETDFKNNNKEKNSKDSGNSEKSPDTDKTSDNKTTESKSEKSDNKKSEKTKTSKNAA